MRVVLISKICVVGAYQRKLEELARLPDLELIVIVPPYWQEGRARLVLEREHVAGYELLVEPIAFNGRFHLHFYPRLARRLRDLRPDLVHIDEEPYNLATAQATWLACRYGAKKLFFTWQNLLRRYPLPFRALERYTLSRAEAALAGNQEAVAVLRAKGYRGPVQVIPQFGVDPELYRPAPRDPAPGAAWTIGYAGRLVPEKGVPLLVQAAARLNGDWRLEIVGDGPERDSLQTLAEQLGVAERVRFVGRVPASRIPEYLRRWDVLVLPSLTRPNWKEQFGRILAEAMACETPVIGSDSGEIPHVIGDGGLVFPEGDVEALLARLVEVQSAPEPRARWGAAGRRRVLAHYTQARIAAETYEVYQKVAGTKTKKTGCTG